MTEALTLLRTEPRARPFFAAVAQSSIGTGAGYVALLVVAYDRFHSPWAISLVLLADFLPAMLFGPMLGAAADRWSRRWCAVVADVVRAVAFVGIVFVDSFEATVALALLAGLGTALFRPAVLAGLPSLVPRERTAAATSLYGALTDLGFTVGPAVAAGVLVVFSAEDLLAANGATFLVSALVIARVPFGEVAGAAERRHGARGSSLMGETREGLSVSLRMPGISVIVMAFGASMLFGGIFNVVELPFATEDLGTSASGYSVLITVYGLGFVVGSLSGGRGGAAPQLKRRYLQGLALTGIGGITAGLSPALLPAVGAFAIGGLGNGLAVVHQRLLVQTEVDTALQGRVFGVTDGLMSSGFAIGFIIAGGLAELIGTRELVVVTGVGELTIAAIVALLLRRHWIDRPAPMVVPAEGRAESLRGRSADSLGYLHAGQDGTHLVGGSRFWLTLLEDLGERGDDVGVELRSGVRD
jgi:MFS family permease